jgi:hypothetical protein
MEVSEEEVESDNPLDWGASKTIQNRLSKSKSEGNISKEIQFVHRKSLT